MTDAVKYIIRQDPSRGRGSYWAGTGWSGHQSCAERYNLEDSEIDGWGVKTVFAQHVAPFNSARIVRLRLREKTPATLAISFVDSEHRDNPLCPHCGDEADGEELFEDEEGAVDGDERTVRCAACKQEYVATHHVTITYSTRKP